LAIDVASPPYIVGALLGVAFLVAILREIRVAIFGFVFVATLLPFAVIPVSLGVVKPTLVDLCLGSALLVWALRLLADRREGLRSSGVDLPVLLFIGVALTAFVLGTAYQTTSSDARLFLEYLDSIVLFFVVVNWIRDAGTLRRLIGGLVGGGVGAAVLAIWLYDLPAATATRYLASLSRIGYPDTGILQYIAGTQIQRAIGTSTDPNTLGATLMICGTLAVGLLILARTRSQQMVLLGGLALIVGALLLTYSRGSLIGFLAGCAVIATFRYRRLWLIAGLLLLALALSGELARSNFVSHLQSGIEVQDQAAAMRLGEYKDAFRLIQEYPVFGVGFGSAPNVDLYIGVSSIYLMIAENVGLVGLAVWLWAMGSIVVKGLRNLARGADEVTTLGIAALGALVSVLVAGLFDHHFVDIHFPHVVALVWLVAGLVVVAADIGRQGISSD
jgi:O-antigen ligase